MIIFSNSPLCVSSTEALAGGNVAYGKKSHLSLLWGKEERAVVREEEREREKKTSAIEVIHAPPIRAPLEKAVLLPRSSPAAPNFLQLQ